MKGLTTRQKAMLDYIKSHFAEKRYWPSIREIQSSFGFKSTNAVMGHLRALENKGFLSRIPGQARAYQMHSDDIDFPGMETNTISIPIYGSIAAGYPDHVESSEAIGNLQIDISTAGIKNRSNAFALKVRGESMINAGIYDGDVVIVEKDTPKSNDIVAALINGETTLKRFISEAAATPYLKAENPNYPDLLPATDLQVQGVARSVIRNFCAA